MSKGGKRTDAKPDKYRPKLDATARSKIIGALQVGADVKMAAAVVGCSARAIYGLRKRSEKFAQEMDDARAIADERIVKSLFDSARDGNVTAMIFWLKNRRPDQWRDRHDYEIKKTEERRVYVAEFADGSEYGEVEAPAPSDVSTETVN